MSDDATQVIRTLAGSMWDIQQQAAQQYQPVVDDILRNASRDGWHIEHTLRLLDFCGCEPVLEMYKKLCRHYWDIDTEAAVYYVSAYREYWDSELRRLRDRSLLDLHPHGANSYYTLPTTLSAPTQPLIDQDNRGEPSPDRGGLTENRGEPALDRGELAPNRGERDTDRGELAPEVLAAIQQLGTRPRKERLRAVIASICAQRDWTTPAELARWLNIRPANLTERYLSPMVKAGQIERRFPDAPTHAEQAYRSSGGQLPLGLSGESEK